MEFKKPSEIASRVGKDTSAISEPLAKLCDLGYVCREVPFGENPKKSKKGLYHINDSLLRFHYQFITPYRSLLELGKIDTVMEVVNSQLPQFVGYCWELLCRNYVSGNIINGIIYNLASRWWGKIFPPDCKEGKMIELDVVAESIDKRHILIGECKWTHDDDADRLMDVLAEKAKYLPFIKKGQEVHLVLFLKEYPHKMTKKMKIILPEDVIKA